jgi:hypothetical protein
MLGRGHREMPPPVDSSASIAAPQGGLEVLGQYFGGAVAIAPVALVPCAAVRIEARHHATAFA